MGRFDNVNKSGNGFIIDDSDTEMRKHFEKIAREAQCKGKKTTPKIKQKVAGNQALNAK